MGRRGSALPGLVVEKIYPGFLHKTLSLLPKGVIIITGTNGKTTTTKITSELLASQGLRVLSNPTGSNFVRGIIATIIENISLNGQLPYDMAVFEQDEAHAVKLTKFIKPHGVVVLNIMRDQMDRFGEIDTTAKLVGKVAAAATDWVVLNANDPRVSGLKDKISAKKVVWFGHGRALKASVVSDDQHYKQDRADYFSATSKIDVSLQDVSDGQVDLLIDGKSHDFVTQLDGTHNGLNIAAALAVVEALPGSIDHPRLAEALASVEPAFGRGERMILKDGTQLRLQLVKNPAGFNHSLKTLKHHDFAAIGIAINDNHPDGRDVSWLWDVDFSPLKQQSKELFCGGIRAYDMALRLKYDDIEQGTATDDIKRFLDSVLKPATGKSAIIYCTYTAMLALRQMLKSKAAKMNQEGL